MRWLFLICGGLATAAMFVISMRLNFLFGVTLGQTPENAFVFGCVSVVADAWKGLGPIFVFALLRDRRIPSAVAAGTVWCACFLFSVSSALGIAIQDRSSITGGREMLQATYDDARAQIDEIEGRRKLLPQHRSIGEIEAAIALRLSQPVGDPSRARKTVGQISTNCTRFDSRTAETCTIVVELRQELAAAVEGVRLDERLRALQQQVAALRERGAGQLSDPQAQLISRITRGWLSTGDVAPGLALLLAAVIELVSAFGPVVLAAYADATRTQSEPESTHPGVIVATSRDLSRHLAARPDQREAVIEYMVECIAPADDASGIGGDDIYGDYVTWCSRKKCAALPRREFLEEFDRKRKQHELEDKIRKFGNRYFGIRLSSLMLIK